MGVDTKGYIRADIEIRDVKKVLENHVKATDVKISFNNSQESTYLTFITPNGETKSIFSLITTTVLGPAR